MNPPPSPPEISLNLLVIRSAMPATLAAFYARLGLKFTDHRHGNGPTHHAAIIGELVLEIYPLLRTQAHPDTALRIGFTVQDVATAISALGAKVVSAPAPSPWGVRAVIEDPEGRRVELVQG